MTTRYRTEKDSMGEVRVPAEAYWGAQAQRAVENFPISGLRTDRKLIWATAAVKRAAALANRDLGKLDPALSEYIVRAAREVMEGGLDDQFVVDVFQAGAGTSHNMNTNEVITNRALELMGKQRGEYSHCHPNDHVNMSQSTNDVFPTAMRLAGLASFTELAREVDLLAGVFRYKAGEFDGIIKSGRTHLQDAVPIRLGQEFSGYTAAMEYCMGRLMDAMNALGELGIGGTAVGTGINSGKGYVALTVKHLRDITGLDLRPSPNLFFSMQSQAQVLSASGALRGLAVELIRISNDLRLLSSGPLTGLAEINLPAVQPGSSIMPGKVNPVMAEMTDMVCFQVLGNDHAVAMAVQAGQLELNVMMPVMAHNLLSSTGILKNTLIVFREKCVAGITVNEGRCKAYVDKSLGIATALNPFIGYMKAAEVAKEALNSGRSVAEVAREKGYMTDEELRRALDPMRLTEP